MNFDQLHCDGSLKGLSMRASLRATGASTPSRFCPAWELHYHWVGQEREPLLISLALRLLYLGGSTCCAVQGRAITRGVGNPQDEDERTFVYLLNQADPTVWLAIDGWVQARCLTAQSPKYGHGTSMSSSDLLALAARDCEGEELESDMLGGSILQLLRDGRLEVEVARQLDVKTPLYCAVVETPMLLASLQPVDQEEKRLRKEHEWNTWVNEGIWS